LRSHNSEMHKQKIEYYKKWTSKAHMEESEYIRAIETSKKELDKLKSMKDTLNKKLMQTEEEEGIKLLKTLERVIYVLRGKEELPDGSYISVSRALQIYTQLKEAAERNTFTVDFFKNFLREHKEFGASVPETNFRSELQKNLKDIV
jgi:hypothetical protein